MGIAGTIALVSRIVEYKSWQLCTSDTQRPTIYPVSLSTSSAAKEWSTVNVHAQVYAEETKFDTSLVVVRSMVY